MPTLKRASQLHKGDNFLYDGTVYYITEVAHTMSCIRLRTIYDTSEGYGYERVLNLPKALIVRVYKP
jgi:hypothetical protein